MSSLDLINSSYALNGLWTGGYNGCYGGYGGVGYGTYGGGLNTTANAEKAKVNIANNYDVFATKQGYNNKQGVETMNYNQACTLIQQDLKNKETDQAASRFEEMVNSMKNSSQYANYSDNEVRALLLNQYSTTTGSDLIADINKYSSNDFVQGLKRGATFGILTPSNSSGDLIARVTGSDKTLSEKALKITGTTLGAAATAGTVYTATVGLKKSGILKTIKDHLFNSTNLAKHTRVGLALAGLAAGVGLIASVLSSKKNTRSK